MRVTLSDIAKKVGVSPSTVQRALNGVEGVGDAKREEIRLLAAEMGYRRNPHAFSLKMGTRVVAIVLPEASRNNRYYAPYLWDGAKEYAGNYTDSLIDILEFPYVRTPESHAAKLGEVLENHGDKLDGILTMGTPEAARVLAGFRERGKPVVFVGTDAQAGDRLCCVRTFDTMAGRMAADLLVNFTEPKRRRKVVITGDMLIPDQFYNAQGFELHILESGFPLEILKLANDPDPDSVKEGIREVLDSSLDVAAVYATSARNTVPMCRAIMESANGSGVRSIGSDIFPESIELIRKNRLNAIIHKRPSTQAYQAMQVLINYVVQGTPPAADLLLVDSVIVMKSNIERFV